ELLDSKNQPQRIARGGLARMPLRQQRIDHRGLEPASVAADPLDDAARLRGVERRQHQRFHARTFGERLGGTSGYGSRDKPGVDRPRSRQTAGKSPARRLLELVERIDQDDDATP